MKTDIRPPLILLAFANEQQKGARYLRALPDESRALQDALRPAEKAGLCEVRVLANVTPKQMFDTFQDSEYRDRIAVFHYGGHAGSFELLLEASGGKSSRADSAGLVPLLGGQKGLQLVFLNGCSTEKLARQLNTAGVPLVIGTFEAISDQVAQLLAERFYSGLGAGLSINRAWREASANVLLDSDGKVRGLGWEETNLDRFPWELFQKAGAEIDLEWNLPDAANNPLAFLPFEPKSYPLPEEPYRFLGRYTKQDAPIFFGRAHHIRDLYNRLTNPLGSPIICLSGQSGVGKSSFLEAGLLPRIEQECHCLYVRRDPEKGLSDTLLDALADTSGAGAEATIAGHWKALESLHKKPLIVLLDQAEEAFTRPSVSGTGEFDALLAALKALWGNPASQPAGKLVLSFRKEFDAEIEDILKTHKIPHETVFLKKLSKTEIIEVVKGLASSERMRQKYGVQIEEGLPELLAADLLSDTDTPVAPMLQIILTKLWQGLPEKPERVFSVPDYLALKEEGIFLGDFFRQQMEQISAWEQALKNSAESSGLALDLLNAHATDLGFSNSCSLDELRKTYSHRADLLDKLMVLFKELYLLTDIGKNRNALAHDTLAPIIQQEFKNSNRRGQKAMRVLAGKTANFKRQPEQTFIDEDDLRLVEHGADGMRMWMPEEAELIEKSRTRRKKLRRQKHLMLSGIFLLLIAAAWFGYGYYQKLQIEKWTAQARLEAGVDPTLALNTLQKAIAISPNNPSVLAALYEIYSNNEFYDTTFTLPDPVKGLALAPDSSGAIYAWTKKAIYRQSRNQAQRDSFLLDNLSAVALSPDGRWLFAGTWEGDLLRLDAAQLRQEEKAHSIQEGAIAKLAFSPDGHTLFSGGNKQISIFNLPNIQTIANHFTLEKELSALQYHPQRDALLLGYKDGTIEERSKNGAIFQTLNRHKDQVLSFAIPPADSSFVSTGRDAVLNFWDNHNQLLLSVKGHDRRINSIAWTPDGQRLLSASTDHQLKSWTPQGDWISTYKGHQSFVEGLAISANGRYVVSAGEDKTVRVWRIESKVSRHFGPHANAVTGALFSPDATRVITTSDAGIHNAGENMNDPDFDFGQFLEATFNPPPRQAYRWNAATEAKLQTLEGHQGGINALAQTSDGGILATASDDNTVIFWDPTGKKQQTLSSGHRNKILGLAFSPDRKYLVTAGFDSTAILWTTEGKKLKVLTHPTVVSAVAFHPKSGQFATGCYDGIVRLFDLNGNLVDSFHNPDQNRIGALCFSPNGQILLAGEWNNKAHLYSLGNKKNETLEITLLSENRTGGAAIRSADFSPDGLMFCLGAEGGLAIVYQLVGTKPIPVFELRHYPRKSILSVRFSADGKRLLTGSNDGWARVWELN